MEHFRLLAFLAVCFAAAGADPEPISTPYIPCKALTPLKTLNLQQLTGAWVTKKLYALNEQSAAIGEQIAKPGQRCSQQEIAGVNGLALQLAVIDSKLNTRNLSSCAVDRSVHGLWTCSTMGKGPFGVMVLMAEPTSFMLVASACVSAKNFPGLEEYGTDRFAVTLWLMQKKDSAEISPEKIRLIDQKVQQVFQRQPIQRQIDCTKRGNQGGPQGGNQIGYYGGASHLNNQDLNDFDNDDVGIGRPPGQGGFVNAQDRDKHKHRPGGVQFPNGNGNGHQGQQGGSTVLKPGVTYAKPGNQSPLQGGQYHHDPEVNKLLAKIHNWYKDPRNKKNGHHGGQGNQGGYGNNGSNGFGNNNNNGFGNNNNNGFGDYGTGFENQGNNGLGFRLGGNKGSTVSESATGQTEPSNLEASSEFPKYLEIDEEEKFE